MMMQYLEIMPLMVDALNLNQMGVYMRVVRASIR